MKSYLLFGLLFLITSCERGFNGQIEIDDVSKKSKYKVVSEYSNRSNIRLLITGETDGAFRVFGIPFEKGKVNKEYIPDAYEDTLILDYEPITAKKGKIIIKYDY